VNGNLPQKVTVGCKNIFSKKALIVQRTYHVYVRVVRDEGYRAEEQSAQNKTFAIHRVRGEESEVLVCLGDDQSV
jgi:hypothetical protein